MKYPVCFRELWRKHGDLITLQTFGQTMIVVCGHKTLTEVLEKNGENTYEHPFVFGFREYFECSGMFSFLIWVKKIICLNKNDVCLFRTCMFTQQ